MQDILSVVTPLIFESTRGGYWNGITWYSVRVSKGVVYHFMFNPYIIHPKMPKEIGDTIVLKHWLLLQIFNKFLN